MVASCTPCDGSFTSSRAGHRVALTRRRRSASASSGKSTRNGRMLPSAACAGCEAATPIAPTVPTAAAAVMRLRLLIVMLRLPCPLDRTKAGGCGGPPLGSSGPRCRRYLRIDWPNQWSGSTGVTCEYEVTRLAGLVTGEAGVVDRLAGGLAVVELREAPAAGRRVLLRILHHELHAVLGRARDMGLGLAEGLVVLLRRVVAPGEPRDDRAVGEGQGAVAIG